MSESQSRFWWLLPAPSNREPSPPVAEQEIPNPIQQPPQGRFWDWSLTTTSDPHAKSASIDNAIAPLKEDAPVESSSFWALMFGSSKDPQTESKHADPLQEPQKEDESSSWWLPWPFLLQAPEDLESDVEDSSNAELFKSAKLAVETARDSCHYAVFCKHGTHDVELAVAGNDTETQPVKYNHKKRPLISNEIIETSLYSQRQKKADLPPTTEAGAESAFKSRKKSPDRSTKVEDQAKSVINPDQGKDPSQSKDSTSESLKAEPAPANSRSQSANQATKPEPTILPKLDDNFRTITMKTKLRLVGEAFVHGSQTSEKHLYRSTDKQIQQKKRKRTRKIVVIGVHSFLPTKLVKSLIGQSTGSAVVLANNALDAVEQWMSENKDCHFDIDTIALEGHGTINDRVTMSMKLLRNWKEHINKSDFVFVAANSIASPVAIKLVSQMLLSPHFGHLKGKKVGLLSIAGAMFGPFANTDSKVVIRAYTKAENEVIGEMFELQKSKSPLSTDITECLSHLCSCNVKITMIGSLNDQFIPLHSSTSNQILHPNIFKCLYVDGTSDVAPFMIQLMSMALTMVNVGYGDQNLIRDLGDRLQGVASSLGTHGRIFNESEVYQTGVRFAMETTSLVYHIPTRYDRIAPTTAEADKNLYNLPWNVRGLINDLVSIKNIRNLLMLKKLVEEYAKWEPSTRVWRDIRYCFAALEDITVDELLL